MANRKLRFVALIAVLLVLVCALVACTTTTTKANYNVIIHLGDGQSDITWDRQADFPTLSKEHYTVEGLYLDAEFKTATSIEDLKAMWLTADIDVYVNWTKIIYKITVHPANGEQDVIWEPAPGNTPPQFTKVGYIMDGFYFDENCTQSAGTVFEEELFENKEVWVKWVECDHKAVTDWTIDSKPTCTEDGHKIATCPTCQKELEDTVAALGHELTHHAKVGATCTADGTKEYWSCATCNKNFADEKGTTELVDIVIEALGHDTNGSVAHKDATCTEDGVVGGTYCKRCGHGKEAAEAVIPALGHDYSENWTIDKDATCTEDGSKSHHCTHTGCDSVSDVTTIPAGHNYGDWIVEVAATCETDGILGHYHCSACGKDFDVNKNELASLTIVATGHSMTKVCKDEDGHWTACANEGCAHTTAKESHTWNEGVQTKEPTETEEGEKTFTCTFCQQTKIEYTGKADHVHKFDTTTWECDGDYHWHPTTCGHTIKDETSGYAKHVYGDVKYTWSTDYTKCTAIHVCACGHSESEEATISTSVTNATCTTAKYTTYTATFKNTAFETQTIENIKTGDELGHNYGAWIAQKDADCTNTGTLGHYHCSACEKDFDIDKKELDSLTIAVDADAHNYGNWITEISATCETVGTKGHYHCSICEKDFDADYAELSDLTIVATGHKWDEVQYTEPHKDEDGNWVCTATRVCKHDSAHAEVLYAHESNGRLTITVTQEASCEKPELCTFTVNYNNVTTTFAENKTYINVQTADALGHNTEGHVDHVDATCTSTGIVGGDYCTRCDHGKADAEAIIPIDSDNHTYGDWIDKVPETCTTDGKEAHYHCACDQYFNASKEAVEESELVIKAHHTYTDVVTEPTCTAQGYTTHTCECGDTYVDTYVDAKGHSYGEIVNESAATIGSDGKFQNGMKAHYQCSACEEYFDEDQNETTKDALAIAFNTEKQYTVAEIVELTKDIAKNKYTEERLYVKGIIKSCAQGSYITQIYLVDEAGDETSFFVYSCNFSESVDKVYDGDAVVVYGYIKNYNDSQIQMATANSTYPSFISRIAGQGTISVGDAEHATVEVTNDQQTGTNDSEFTFKVTAEEGYEIVQVKVNGTEVPAVDGTYTATIKGNTTITVETKENGAVDPVLAATISFETKDARTYFDTTKTEWKNQGATFVNEKNNSSTDCNDSSGDVRLYVKSKNTLTYAGMSKVIFEVTKGYLGDLATLLEEYGTVITSGTTVTLTCGSTVDSIVIEPTKQTRLTKVSIYKLPPEDGNYSINVDSPNADVELSKQTGQIEDNFTFTVTVEDGYQLKSVFVNGEEVQVGDNNVYEGKIIGYQTSVKVVTEKILQTFSITISAINAKVTDVDGNEITSPTTATENSEFKFKVVPTDDDYKVDTVKVGDETLNATGGVYTIKVTGDTTITIETAESTSGGEGETETPSPVTETIKISEYANDNGWSNGTQYSTVVGTKFTVTATGTSNTGKYYTNGNDWRIYQNESPAVTITANEGYTIVSVKVTYTIANIGVLTKDGSNIESASTVDVNASSVTFGVGNTGTKTNGQVKITAIEVVYKAA